MTTWSSWPDPRDPLGVEWRLRHLRTTFNAEVSTSDLMVAASYMDAYRALIALPQRARNQRIEQIKRAMRAPVPDVPNGKEGQ